MAQFFGALIDLLSQLIRKTERTEKIDFVPLLFTRFTFFAQTQQVM